MCDVGRRLWQRDLIGAAEGNITCRLNSRHLLCTPTGLSKGHLRPNDLVVTDMSGNLVRGDRLPSSEIRLHVAIYRARKDCQAVIHAHPPVATAFSVAGEPIPDDILPESAMVLGCVATVPFAFPGTDEVPQKLEPFLEGHKTLLLSHHGAAVMGADLWSACNRLETLERVAKVLLYAKLLGGAKPMPQSAFERLSSALASKL